MFKLFKTAAIFVTLLSAAGLTGCSSSKDKPVDRFKTDSIRIVGQNGKALDVEAFSKLSQKTLDLQDSIDYTNTGSARAKILSNCSRENDVTLAKASELPGNSTVKIYRLIADEFLTRDLSKPLNCSFTVDLYNETGSNNVKPTIVSSVVDAQTSEIAIQQGPGTQVTQSSQKLVTSYEEADQILIRHQNGGSEVAHILCQDVTVAPLNFENVLELVKFDLLNPTLQPGREASILVERPQQLCRVLATKDDQIVGISALFALRFMQQDFVVEISRTPYKDLVDKDSFFNKWVNPFLAGTQDLEQTEISITNNTLGSRRLRFSKAKLSGEVGLHIYTANTGLRAGTKQQLVNPEVYYVLNPQGRTIVETLNDRDFSYAVLPPGDTLKVSLRFKMPKAVSCTGQSASQIVGLTMTPTSAGSFDELNEDNSVSKSWALPKGAPSLMWWDNTAMAHFSYYTVGSPSLCK